MTAREAREAPDRYCRECAGYTHERYVDMTGDGGRGIEATGECSICGERYDEPGWYNVTGADGRLAKVQAKRPELAAIKAINAGLVRAPATARWWTDELPEAFGWVAGCA